MSVIYKIIKKLFIAPLKRLVKPIFFFMEYGFMPPPIWSDLSGYELLLDAILEKGILKVEGDFIEIGVFLGGGTYKLCKILERYYLHKKLYAIDIFSPDFDKTFCTQGIAMNEMYRTILKDRDQTEVYKQITKSCSNLITITGDSMKIKLPCKKIAFAFIDGNHSPAYVANDFHLVWDKVSSYGIVAFDDYGYDLPQVTNTINELIKENSDKILKIWTSAPKTIFIQKK